MTAWDTGFRYAHLKKPLKFWLSLMLPPLPISVLSVCKRVWKGRAVFSPRTSLSCVVIGCILKGSQFSSLDLRGAVFDLTHLISHFQPDEKTCFSETHTTGIKRSK